MNRRSLRALLALLAFSTIACLFFALPMLWLVTAPFNPQTTLRAAIPAEPSLANFQTVFDNSFAIRALFVNNLIFGAGTAAAVVIVATLAS